MDHALAARSVRRAVTREGLHTFEAAYEPGSRLLEHEHAAPFFCYVLLGEFTERAGGVTRECSRGSLIFHGQHEPHANFVGPNGTRSLNVEIPIDTWRELTAALPERFDITGRVLSGDAEWPALAVWREFHRDDQASVIGLDEAVALLCSAVTQSARRGAFEPHPRLERCAEFLREHAAAAPRLAEVAAIAGVHPMHLAKLFRKRFGCSMGEFVRRQRIAWACGALARDRGTIAAIALEAGFSDHAHFTRTFRRVTGCSPSWYRDRVGKKASSVQDRGGNLP